MTATALLLSPWSSPAPGLRRRLYIASKPRFFIRSPRTTHRVLSSQRPSTDAEEDFISRTVKDNPSQIERRVLVGGRMFKKSEKASTPRDKESSTAKNPVRLKDILREFRGQLYVPEEVVLPRVVRSEEEAEFERNIKLLPKMEEKDFLKCVRTDKVKSLTFMSSKRNSFFYMDIVVDLKEIPGDMSAHQRRWAVRLSKSLWSMVSVDYNGPQYEIERSSTTVGKLYQAPHPVAGSISAGVLVTLAFSAAVLALVASTAVIYVGPAVLVASPFLFLFYSVVALVATSSFGIWLISHAAYLLPNLLDMAWDRFVDVFGDGGLIWRMYLLAVMPRTDLTVIRIVVATLLFMVFFIRYTLSRKPKDFRKWDIWQGIEFSQSKATARVDGSTGVFFRDVAGIDEAVEELQELVQYLKNPQLFDEKGIKPPHGVLLEGPPGCGKTLVAKAIAGEAGVPFYQMAGSEFVEVLVGVGSARVRDLFARAKVNKPSVVFIDEIDALGTKREGIYNRKRNLYNAAVQERETTLNQLLIELDGFDTGKGVIFLGATNRKDLLDPALLRPGRFDRKIKIKPPGAKGRLDILKVHSSKVKMSPSVDLSAYAQNLTGWTGARLAQLLQEAALVAVRRKHSAILQEDLDEAVDCLTLGPKHVGIKLSLQGQIRRATMEAGLAMTSHLLRRYEAADLEFCERISIHPRGGTLSQTVFLRLNDESYEYARKPQLLHRLQLLLGARAAEEVAFGKDSSTISAPYLADAYWLARKILSVWNLESPMVIHGDCCPQIKGTRFIGPRLDFEGSLYRDYGLFEPPLNLYMEDELARRAEALVSKMYTKTLSLLRKHQAALVKIIKVLVEHKEIRGHSIDYILDHYPGETPVTLVLNEQNPGSLPFFGVEGDQQELLLSPEKGMELSPVS